MAMNSEELATKTWDTICNVHDQIRAGQDRLCMAYGLTVEQYSVLRAIKELEKPVRITDVARKTVRSVNSVSMLVDRMLKVGLVKRVRDKKDRRTVFVSATEKGSAKMFQAAEASQSYIFSVLAPIAYGDQEIMIRLLESVLPQRAE